MQCKCLTQISKAVSAVQGSTKSSIGVQQQLVKLPQVQQTNTEAFYCLLHARVVPA